MDRSHRLIVFSERSNATANKPKPCSHSITQKVDLHAEVKRKLQTTKF